MSRWIQGPQMCSGPCLVPFYAGGNALANGRHRAPHTSRNSSVPMSDFREPFGYGGVKVAVVMQRSQTFFRGGYRARQQTAGSPESARPS